MDEQERIAQGLFDLQDAYAQLCRELGESSHAGNSELVNMAMLFSLALSSFVTVVADQFDIVLVPMHAAELFKMQDEARQQAENN
jgi:uncharacterized protein YqhQ